MHRDPRFSDVEKVIGSLVLSIGAGMCVPWDSRMSGMLQEWGLGSTWIALYLLVGTGLWIASALHTLLPRILLLIASAVLWGLLAAISRHLKMPIAMLFAGVLVGWSLFAAWRISRSI